MKRGSRLTRRELGLFSMLALVVATPSAALGQPEPFGEPTTAETDTESAAQSERARTDARVRAQQIRALMDGTLDPSVDPVSLFSVALGGELRQTLLPAADLPSAPLGSPEEALEELRSARRAFLQQPAAARSQQVSRHAEAQARAAAAADLQQAADARLAAVQTEAAALRAFLAGELPTDTDPQPLVRVNLLDPFDLGEGWARALRLFEESGPVSPPDNVDDVFLAAEHELDAARRAYLALSDTEQESLFAQHRARLEAEAVPTEPIETPDDALLQARLAAELATAESEQAQASAHAADTESLRLVAAERARLLVIKADQAQLRIQLVAARQQIAADYEAAAVWSRRVSMLSNGEVADQGQREADAMYPELVLALTAARRNLRSTLSHIRSSSTSVPEPGQGANLPTHLDTSDLAQLQQQLASAALELSAELETVEWREAESQRASIVEMNGARLSLLTVVSRDLRASLRGFGTPGVQQAGRELEQITLEAKYHLYASPRFFRTEFEAVKAAPFSVMLLLLKLAVVLFLFVAWRRRANTVLSSIIVHYSSQTPSTTFARAAAATGWYAKRLRGPLEWLLLFFVVRLLLDANGVPALAYVWPVLLWIVLGNLVVRLIDAIAARRGKKSADSTSLRFRSLRVVGVTVVVIALVLSLTTEIVGVGTIHSWVWTSCWILVVPISLMLLHWWRPTVLARAKTDSTQSSILRWVGTRDSGVTSYLAAAAGGVVLVWASLKRAALRSVSNLSFMQRLLAYTFRREVEKQSEEVSGEDRGEPIDAEIRRAIVGQRTADSPLVAVMSEELKLAQQLIAGERSSTLAVVGERGLGRSTFLDQAASKSSEKDILRLVCEPGGFAPLLGQLAEAVGLSAEAAETEVADKIRELGLRAILIDDANRLVRPLIGGLKEVDHLVNFARSIGGRTSWVLSFAGPAWQYLKRARADRAVFDDVIKLKRWSETEIGELIRERCAAANLHPSYDKLVSAQPPHAATDDSDDRARDYHRILWDYANGNPAIALHFFAESLMVRDEKTSVHLFRRPQVTSLEAAPLSLYFVLRSVIQLDLADPADVVACTDLHTAEVYDALRLSEASGYLERTGERLRLSITWYRAISYLLKRHHLLLEEK